MRETSLSESNSTFAKSKVGVEVQQCADIGAVIYYLKMVPWSVRGFDASTNLAPIRRLRERMGKEPQRIRQRRFLVVGGKGGWKGVAKVLCRSHPNE